jgi:hypothetical protein
MIYVKVNDCASSDNEVAAVINDKAAKWDQIREDVKLLVDKLGKPVDDGIIETVTAFQALGFSTAASCAGHVEHGCPYPWVDFEVNDSSKSENALIRKSKIIRQRRLLESRVINMLEGYYFEHQVPYHAMLMIEPFDPDYFRLRFAGGEVSEVMGFDKRQERLKIYKAEMETFSTFLKAMFLHG